jgi:acyl dehydratase
VSDSKTLDVRPKKMVPTQERMNEFGRASGSAGRVHTDPEWAGPVFGSTLAQGMMVVDLVVQMMVDACGLEKWCDGGRMKAKFVGMMRPGDTIVARLDDYEIVEEGGRKLVRGNFTCENGEGVAVIVGEVEGPLS